MHGDCTSLHDGFRWVPQLSVDSFEGSFGVRGAMDVGNHAIGEAIAARKVTLQSISAICGSPSTFELLPPWTFS
jgi:hypothetical protein